MAISISLMLFISLFQTVSFAVNTIGSFQSITDGTTMISKGGMFELGFFSPGNSRNRYVGIWYRNIPVRTSKSVVWFTSSSKQPKKPIVQLLDSGNLVLRDEEVENIETNYLWQSFEHPSDTILPGMELGWDSRTGLNRQILAWRNWDDPCPGDLSFVLNVDPHNYPEAYLWKGITPYYRFGPWNGVGVSGSPDIRPNPVLDFHLVYNDNEQYYRFYLKNNSVISRMVFNQTNSIGQHLTWMEGDQSWSVYASAPKDSCGVYGRCGANGNPVISETSICQCLEGFKPKSQAKWDLRD
ncbi:hypothetical protein TIFTF001_026057 [Ficus carica]|uniref:Bulb-type lectin domain-containing protein n=1 Tax=Ficus carica TaxID=3494 RepID=A0AA88ANZ1_FICCA|nr:hypothetical protein TIFTF001_026057 [Ficus carica]